MSFKTSSEVGMAAQGVKVEQIKIGKIKKYFIAIKYGIFHFRLVEHGLFLLPTQVQILAVVSF